MGNSSSDGGLAAAKEVPGCRMGNSSSSSGFGIGMGPDILPRMDGLAGGLDRPALELDLKRLTFMASRWIASLEEGVATCTRRGGLGGKDDEGQRGAVDNLKGDDWSHPQRALSDSRGEMSDSALNAQLLGRAEFHMASNAARPWVGTEEVCLVGRPASSAAAVAASDW